MAVRSLTDIILSPKEVREMLNISNDEIIYLCKQASIIPRKNNKGLTYFSYAEAQRLGKIKETRQTLAKIAPDAVLEQVISSFSKIEDNVSKKVLTSIDSTIDSKMQGVQEMVLELVMNQAENQQLKQKIAELNKENTKLKTELRNFQKLGLGFYKKSKIKDYSI